MAYVAMNYLHLVLIVLVMELDLVLQQIYFFSYQSSTFFTDSSILSSDVSSK